MKVKVLADLPDTRKGYLPIYRGEELELLVYEEKGWCLAIKRGFVPSNYIELPLNSNIDSKITKSNDNSHYTIQVLQTSVQQLEQQNAQLNDTIKQLEALKTSLSTKIQQLEAENKALQNKGSVQGQFTASSSSPQTIPNRINSSTSFRAISPSPLSSQRHSVVFTSSNQAASAELQQFIHSCCAKYGVAKGFGYQVIANLEVQLVEALKSQYIYSLDLLKQLPERIYTKLEIPNDLQTLIKTELQ